MKKRIFSMLLAVILVMGLLPTAAFAAGATDTWAMELNVSENNKLQYNGQDVLEIAFGVQSNDLKLKTIEHVAFAVDLEIFDFLFKDGRKLTEVLASDGVSDNIGTKVAYSKLTDAVTYIEWNADAYYAISADSKIGYIVLQPTQGSGLQDCSTEVNLASVLVGFKKGKSTKNLTKTSIRFMTVEEATRFNQEGSVALTDGDLKRQVYDPTTATADPLLGVTPCVDWGTITIPLPQLPGSVAISGTAKYGEKLTATASNLPIDATAVYQWYRGNIAISGATKAEYTIVEDDIGAKLTVKVSDSSGTYGGTVDATTADFVAKLDYTGAGATQAAVTKTADTVTVASVISGQEYAITTGSNPPTDWNTTGAFTGLTPNTVYTVHTRVKATTTTNASDSVTTSVTTSKLAQIITADNQSVMVGGTLNLVASSNAAAAGAKLVYSIEGTPLEGTTLSGSTVTAGTTPGSFTVKITSAAVGSYDAAEKTITVTVSAKTAQVFAAGFNTAADKNYGDMSFFKKATLTTGDGGITYASGTPAVATVNPTTGAVTILKKGTTVITATAAETDSFAKATVSYTLTVAPATITVTAGSYKVSKAYDGAVTAGAASGALSSSGILPADSGVTVETGTIPVYSKSDVHNGMLTLPISLAGNEAGNYTLGSVSTVSVPCEITAKPLTIKSATATVRDYAAGDKNVAISAVSFNESAPVPAINSGVTATGTMTTPDAGNNSVNVTVTLTDGNYTLAERNTTTTVTINKIAYTGAPVAVAKSVLINQTQTGVEVDMASAISSIAGAAVSGASEGTDESNLIDAVTVSGTKVKFNVASVATAGTVATINVTVSSTNFENITATITVTTEGKAAANVSFSGEVPTIKTYGDVPFALTATVANVGAGGKWTWVSSNPAVLSVSGSTATPNVTVLKTGDATITAEYESATTKGSATTATITVNKAELTATANAHTITYGDAPVGNGVTYSGFVNGDDKAVIKGTVGYDSTYVKYENVGGYTITPKGVSADNYSITVKPGVLTVTAKAVGLTWLNTSDRKFGDGKTVTATATNVVNGDVIAVTVTGGDATAVGTHTATATELTGNKSGNYKLPGTVTQLYTIAQGIPPEITWPTTDAITYAPAKALSSVALKGGSTSLGSFAWTTGPTIPTVAAGTYSVTFTPTAEAIRDYGLSTKTQNVALTVSRAAQTKPTFTLSASTVKLNGNVSITKLNTSAAFETPVVSYASSNTTVADISVNGEITLKAAGNTNITVSYDQTANYNAATSTQATLNVQPLSANKAITSFKIGTAVGVINDGAGTIAVTVPCNTNPVSLTPIIEHTGVSISPAGAQNFSQPVVYTVTAEDSSTKAYTITVTIAAKEVKNPTLANATITYGDATPTWVPVVADGTTGDSTFTYTYDEDGNGGFTDTVPTKAGTHKVKATLVNTNFEGEVTATFTINPKPITINLASATKVYGDTAVTFGEKTLAAGSAMAHSDNFDALKSSIIADSATAKAQSANVAANYGITATGLANYAITVATKASVTKAPLTIAVGSTAGENKVYDGNTTAMVNTDVTISGAKNGETIVFTPKYTFASKDSGTGIAVTAKVTLGSVTGGNALLSNYDLATNTAAVIAANITTTLLTPTGATTLSKGTSEMAGLKVSDFLASVTGNIAPDTKESLFNEAVTGALAAGAITVGPFTITFYTDAGRTATATAIPTTAGTYYYKITGAATDPYETNYSLGTLSEVLGTLTVTAPIVPPPSGDSGGVTPSESIELKQPKTDPVTGNTNVEIVVKPKTKGDTSTAVIPDKVMKDAISSVVKEAAKTGGTSSVEIVIDAPKDAKTVEAELTRTIIRAVAESEVGSLKITSPVAIITFDTQALATIAAEAAEEKVIISAVIVPEKKLDAAQKALVGDAPVYELKVMSGNKIISDFKGGTATIIIPYELKDGEKAEFVTVWYLDDAGKLIPVQGKYEGGFVTFTVDHFSRYAIGYLPFTDVKADWAYESIVYAYQNKLLSGVGNEKFAPADNMTRAMLWTVLYRAAGSPAKTDNANWYADAQAWAMAEKISDGTNPTGNVTRQELATILYRYDKSTAVQADTSGFSDMAEVAEWAADGMNWAVANGILKGIGDKLNPAGNATRAQVATMLQRYLTK